MEKKDLKTNKKKRAEVFSKLFIWTIFSFGCCVVFSATTIFVLEIILDIDTISYKKLFRYSFFIFSVIFGILIFTNRKTN